MDFGKVMTMRSKGHRSKHMTNDTIGVFDLKNIELDAKIIILSALVQSYGQRRLFP